MKKTVKYNLKNLSLALLLLLGLATVTAAKIIDGHPDFSGTWVLNVSKSNFGGLPALVVAPKQLKITNDNDTLDMEMLVHTFSGVDSTETLKLVTTGKTVDMVTADKRTRHYNTVWTDKGQILKEEYSTSFSGNPSADEFHNVFKWSLSADSKELLLDEYVTSPGYDSYSVKAVFEKE